ncbi:hypothetical protein HGRIS_000593 [Hohenbuehelia grisea]|uniref:Heterokaryon incompatibility domain-containing protein n=1 Tax=Hohenbuehelia grisea TaxID=104357 RepID=A0ABR3JTI2_9AGAR
MLAGLPKLDGESELDLLLNWDLYLKSMVTSEIRRVTRYAILSHRWGESELRYDDMNNSGAKAKIQACHKIKCFIARAKEYDCRYAWFDTACINKNSSSELEESIRSMFTWYRNAEVCIVHLEETETTLKISFGSDAWFDRGWTLQELLAPRRLKFYNRRWLPLQNARFDIVRQDHSAQIEDDEEEEPLPNNIAIGDDLKFRISYITGINISELLRFRPGVDKSPVVMNWAASRRTTRPEDIAYCLLGLLDVSLSIAYGEGRDRAFYRLQVECIQRSTTRNLLAWHGARASLQHSMVTSDPAAFEDTAQTSHRIMAAPLFKHTSNPAVDPSITFTNYGLRIALSTYEVTPVSIVPLVGQDRRVSVEMDVRELRLKVWAEWKLITESQVAANWKVGIIGAALMKMWDNNHQLIAYPVLLRSTDSGPPPRFKRIAARFNSELRFDVGYRFKEPVLIFVQ